MVTDRPGRLPEGKRDLPAAVGPRLTQDRWTAIGLRMIGADRAPADVTLQELCRAAEATKGSFKSHFPGGIDYWHQACPPDGSRACTWTGSLRTMHAVHSPADRLRLLTEQMPSDGWVPPVIQRWAAVSPTVVADAASTYSSLTALALQDLELSEGDSQHGGRLLGRAVAGASAPGSDVRAEAEALIAVAERAANWE
jgi:hypothetical protein